MSRNVDEGFQEYKELFQLGIELVFLKEPYVNTSTYKDIMNQRLAIMIHTGDVAMDNLFSTIVSAFEEYQLALVEKQIRLAFEQSEKEVMDIRQRTREGMKASGAGEKISKNKTGMTYQMKKSKVAKQVILKHSKTFGGTLSDTKCIKLAGVAFSTF